MATVTAAAAREKYLLTAADLRQLSKPPLLEEVERVALAKHGSMENLNEEVKRKAEERQSKKRKREEQRAAAVADAQNNTTQRLEMLRASLGSQCEPDVLEWLLQTPEAQTWSRFRGDLSDLSTLTGKLLTFRTEAMTRKESLLATVRQRLIQQERQLLHEVWIQHRVTVQFPSKEALGLCVKLEPRSIEPQGAFVTGFTKNAAGEIGPLEKTSVQVGDVITSVNGIGGSWQNVLMSLNAAHQIAQGKPTGTTVPVQLAVKHFKSAPPEAVALAEARALEPTRLAKAYSSPLVDKYARATHTLNAEIWLFNPSSVANEILLPIERVATLRALLQPHDLDIVELFDGQLRLTSVTANQAEAARLTGVANGLVLFGFLGVTQMLRKFVDDGEVGRGRNKTALNQAKQVVRVLLADFKTAAAGGGGGSGGGPVGAPPTKKQKTSAAGAAAEEGT